MPTLQEHLDNLDRMVDTGAHKPQIVEQIEIIRRIVALNDAEFSDLAQAHTKLQEEHSKLKDAEAKRNRDSSNAMQSISDNQRKLPSLKQLSK